jgi:hypothetical protein
LAEHLTISKSAAEVVCRLLVNDPADAALFPLRQHPFLVNRSVAETLRDVPGNLENVLRWALAWNEDTAP